MRLGGFAIPWPGPLEQVLFWFQEDEKTADSASLAFFFSFAIHVHVVISVGRLVGSGRGASRIPADSSLPSWPLPLDQPATYATDRVLAERTNRQRGRAFEHRCRHNNCKNMAI